VRPGWGCDHPRGLYIVSNWLGAMRRHQVVYIVRKRVSGETLGCAYALLPRQSVKWRPELSCNTSPIFSMVTYCPSLRRRSGQN